MLDQAHRDSPEPAPAGNGHAPLPPDAPEMNDALAARAEYAARLGVPDLPPEHGPTVPEWGAGGEIVPAGAAAAQHPAIVAALRRDYAAVVSDGSLDRCRLAEKAGVLSLALETAQAVLPKSSVDKSVAHHLALAHTLATRFGGYSLQALNAAEAGKDGSAPVALRSARTSARMMSVYRESYGLIERVRDRRLDRLDRGRGRAAG